jgi:hypothetical protein
MFSEFPRSPAMQARFKKLASLKKCRESLRLPAKASGHSQPSFCLLVRPDKRLIDQSRTAVPQQEPNEVRPVRRGDSCQGRLFG